MKKISVQLSFFLKYISKMEECGTVVFWLPGYNTNRDLWVQVNLKIQNDVPVDHIPILLKELGYTSSLISMTTPKVDEEELCTRINFDKRTLRLQHREDFEFAIDQFQKSKKPSDGPARRSYRNSKSISSLPAAGVDNCVLGEKESKVIRWFQSLCRKDTSRASFVLSKLSSIYAASSENAEKNPPVVPSSKHKLPTEGFSVFVRKRPLFNEERSQDFDVVDASDGNKLRIFDTRMKPDLKTMRMVPSIFTFDDVFDDTVSNQHVFESVALPLVHNAMNGGTGSIFMFGQTGSGKTYTLNSILEQTVAVMLAKRQYPVSLSMFEVCGSTCRDLSSDGDQLVIRPLESEDGSLKFQGLTERDFMSRAALTKELELGLDLRATSETGVHDRSSRSHAFYRLRFGEGELLLVDLAGSERNKDSFLHDAKLTKESSEINRSLMALKHVWRAKATGKSHVPFRESILTRILKPCFDNTKSMTAVIATVSPCSSDTEHSLSTLDNVSCLSQFKQIKGNPVAVKSVLGMKTERMYHKMMEMHPKKWTSRQVASWWKSQCDVIPPTTVTGEILLKWSEKRFVQYSQLNSKYKTDNERTKIGLHLYGALRSELAEIRKFKEAKTAS